MIDSGLLKVLTSPPDAGLTIVTQGVDGPHVANSWNSYVQVSRQGKLLIPAGRMTRTEANLKVDNRVTLSITNREVQGKTYKGTGYLVKGTADFKTQGPDFDSIKLKFPWARAALSITIESLEQTL